MRKCQVGGQAVLEGVMMRGKQGTATAVRKPDENIEVDFKKIIPYTKKYKILGLPLIRGFITLIESLVVGMKSLNFSAEFFEEDDEEPSKVEKWLKDKLGDKLNDIIMVLTIIFSLVISLTVFMAIPTGITFLMKKINAPYWSLSIIEGVISIAILLTYMYAIGHVKDIQRVFQYHGAEHKTIFCYENEEELTVENVKKYSRFHPRCGTNFLFLVAIVSIFIFSFTKWDSLTQRTITRIALLPVVSGITYELIKWLGQSEGVISKVIAKPGLMLQQLTTREPDDSQIEVAITALKRAEGVKETEKNIGQLLEYANKELKSQNIETYILDSQLLLGKVLNKEKLWIIINRDKTVSKDEEKSFLSLVEKRKNKMPIQYILGCCEFMGLNFFVKEGVLIPRGDTEILVEEVLKNIEKDSNVKICDLCCGSGVIGLSLAHYRANINVDLIDIDMVPQEVTLKNISDLKLQDRCNFIHSDLLENSINNNYKYNIIVSNPPYIKEDIIETLMDDVKNYEPNLALSGGRDGLIFYRRIIEESKKVLYPQGVLAFEIGYDQGEDVKKLMMENEYLNVRVIKDLAGLDRVVIGNL